MDSTGVLWVATDRYEVGEYAGQGWDLSDAVDISDWPVRRAQLGLVVEDGAVSYLATFHRGPKVATRKRRLTLRNIRSVAPIPLKRFLARMPRREGAHLSRIAKVGGGVVPPLTWQRCLEALFAISVEARDFGTDLLEMVSPNPLSHPAELSIPSEERDAVLLSLAIAGMRRDRLPNRVGDEAHFLDDIDHTIPEDALIIHDASRMPGFGFMREFPGTAIQFRDRRGSRRLTVMNVNRRPLETSTGVDLIYYRHEPDAFVLVQYKRLTQEGDDWVYRPAGDRHLAKEIARMDALDLPTTAAIAPKDYRLSESPFYMKLCKPSYSALSPEDLIPGMYIPLAYWKVLDASVTTKGPRGGTLFGFHNVDRWLTNTLFAELVREAWIGTSGAASSQIAGVIRSSLKLGRSAIVAMESGSAPRRRRK